MLKKNYSKTGSTCRVTFKLPAEVNAKKSFLCGEFNDWDTTATPMVRGRSDANWKVTVELKVGERYGFRYLVDEGVNFTNAHYQHANTETIVGHTSLATGTVPAAHGMVANVWFDREQDRLAYNIEDPDHRLLTAGADVDRKTEIDPTQRAATEKRPRSSAEPSTGKPRPASPSTASSGTKVRSQAWIWGWG